MECSCAGGKLSQSEGGRGREGGRAGRGSWRKKRQREIDTALKACVFETVRSSGSCYRILDGFSLIMIYIRSSLPPMKHRVGMMPGEKDATLRVFTPFQKHQIANGGAWSPKGLNSPKPLNPKPSMTEGRKRHGASGTTSSTRTVRRSL